MEKKIKLEGKIELNNIEVDCYILEDGTRVLSGREMQRLLNMVDEVDADSSQTSGPDCLDI